MEKRIELVEELVSLGYHLMGWTVEGMAKTFDEKTLERFIEAFKNRKG